MAMGDPHQPKPKRRFFRFSLRTLLVVVVLLSVGMGWFAFKMRQAERQRKAVEALKEVSGMIGYDYQTSEGRYVYSRAEPPAPAWLTRLLGVDFLSDVVVVTFLLDVEDEALEHVDVLTNLIGLNLSDTQVTDAGLKHLKGLANLEYLDLNGTHVTEEGIRELQEALPNCQIDH